MIIFSISAVNIKSVYHAYVNETISLFPRCAQDILYAIKSHASFSTSSFLERPASGQL